MKKILLTTTSLLFINSSFAADDAKISRLVRDYSETIACQVDGEGEPGELKQYSTVRLSEGYSAEDDLGSKWLVYWAGDVGCSGGNGSRQPQLTVVAINGFRNTPVVDTSYKLPDTNLVQVTEMKSDQGTVTISGLAYGDNDTQHTPRKKITYKFKFDEQTNKIILQ